MSKQNSANATCFNYLNEAFDNTTQPVILVTHQYGIIYLNKAARKVFHLMNTNKEDLNLSDVFSIKHEDIDYYLSPYTISEPHPLDEQLKLVGPEVYHLHVIPLVGSLLINMTPVYHTEQVQLQAKPGWALTSCKRHANTKNEMNGYDDYVLRNLIKEKEFHHMVMKATNDIIWDLDIATGNIQWNNNFYIQLGYAQSERLYDLDFWLKTVHPEDAEGVENSLNEALSQGVDQWAHEYRFKKYDGSYVSLYDRGYVVKDKAGKPQRMIGSMMDITRLKIVEEELALSYKEIRDLSEHVLYVREENKKKIAREMHDELGQQITVMKIQVAWLTSKLQPVEEDIKQRLLNLDEMLNDSIKSIRRISTELRPSLLDDLGLIAALEWHLKEVGLKMGIQVKFTAGINEPDLTENAKTSLFRIVQESLTNIARHAKATNVSVILSERENTLMLTIKDDGVGMDLQELRHTKTMGIMGMRERAVMIGGVFSVESSVGSGTIITVAVPLLSNS
jgi:PAS domain S-box-containing protein